MENLPLPKLYAAAWVPGRFSTPKSKNLPLERFFPPVPEGMVSNWVRKYAAPGSWLLDPFGQNPYTSLELARAGYRVMISANNPIAAFVLRVWPAPQNNRILTMRWRALKTACPMAAQLKTIYRRFTALIVE